MRGTAFTSADATGAPSWSVRLGRTAVLVQGQDSLPEGRLTHVALVLDTGAQLATLYVEGNPAASAAISGELVALTDVDNWLGRSHVASDPGLSGSLAELRVYDRALTPEELETSHHAGPDPTFLE